jgi:hypothetical protein
LGQGHAENVTDAASGEKRKSGLQNPLADQTLNGRLMLVFPEKCEQPGRIS